MVEDCGDNRFFVRCKCGMAQDKLYGQRCDAVRRWNTRKPPVNPVEVVRCKDCLIHGICRFEQGLGLDGFCSQGERKDD